MRREWPIGNASIPEERDAGMRVDVLVDLEGPQLVLYSKGKQRHIGIFADSDGNAERWLIADTTLLELESLARADLPMRDVFSRKPRLRAVDFDSSRKAIRFWSIATTDVPVGILPVRGAPLPSSARKLLSQKLRLKAAIAKQRRIRFEGAAVSDSSIELGALSTLTRVFQRLWTAIGHALGDSALIDNTLPITAVFASAFKPGSFAVHVKAANDEVFDRVLADYRRILSLAHDDPEKLARELLKHEQLRESLDAYLKALGDLQTETIVEGPSARAYVGCSATRSVRSALKGAVVAPSADDAEKAVEQTTRRGYFDEFGLKDETFAFYDMDADETVTGSVASGLLKRIRDLGTKEAAVGKVTRYRATIERRGSKRFLVDFQRLGQISIPAVE
jgi:hypothetical protein